LAHGATRHRAPRQGRRSHAPVPPGRRHACFARCSSPLTFVGPLATMQSRSVPSPDDAGWKLTASPFERHSSLDAGASLAAKPFRRTAEDGDRLDRETRTTIGVVQVHARRDVTFAFPTFCPSPCRGEEDRLGLILVLGKDNQVRVEQRTGARAVRRRDGQASLMHLQLPSMS